MTIHEFTWKTVWLQSFYLVLYLNLNFISPKIFFSNQLVLENTWFDLALDCLEIADWLFKERDIWQKHQCNELIISQIWYFWIHWFEYWLFLNLLPFAILEIFWNSLQDSFATMIMASKMVQLSPWCPPLRQDKVQSWLYGLLHAKTK